MFGVLNVHKPPAWTSRDVVNRVQRLVRPAKAGHAGTLDPLATGVLVVCIGPATRLIPYVQRMPKTYRARFELGRTSPSDDIETEATLLPNPPVPSRADVQAALSRFCGRIHQTPPAYSAKKVAGERAYRLARKGEPVQLEPRTVEIYELSILDYEYPRLALSIRCSGGTYVRSIGRDVAAFLNTGAVMSELVRSAIGDLRVEGAVQIEQLSAETLAARLQPPLAAVAQLPRLALGPAELTEIRYGRPIDSAAVRRLVDWPSLVSAAQAGRDSERHVELGDEFAAVGPDGNLAAILQVTRGESLRPVRNFTQTP